jgi:arginine/ornithine N-succinyltransferase beta subunit
VSGTPIVRPVRPADAEGVWGLLRSATADTIGMGSLPRRADAVEQLCVDSAETLADLATGEFQLSPAEQRRLLFVGVDRDDRAPFGITGVTFKNAVPNLVVEVATSKDGRGLIMRSSSVPWTRTELDSTYIGPAGRGRGIGTLLSRGRFMLMQLVRRQIPSTVASHLRGRFDDDASAPFWRCFGAHFAPRWTTSAEAEAALAEDSSRLALLADHVLPVTAPVLDSLGQVNEASLPAFHVLRAEGLDPNGMYDPIDGGPTLVADLVETTTAHNRTHGRATPGEAGPLDSLVSVASVDGFRVIRTGITIGDSSDITLAAEVATAAGIAEGTLLAVCPLKATP